MTADEYRPMQDRWIHKVQSCSAFEAILLSSTLFQPQLLSLLFCPASQQEAFYQVAANVVVAAGWPISISFSRKRRCGTHVSTA